MRQTHWHHRPLAVVVATICLALLATACGGDNPVNRKSASPSSSPQTTYTDPSHGYSLTYDSALLAPVTKQSTVDSMSVYVMPNPEMGLALMPRESQAGSDITFLVSAWISLGDYSYDQYLKVLPRFLNVYATYYKGDDGKGDVVSKLKTVDGLRALSYRFRNKAPNFGWLWGDSTIVLTKQGWVQVVVVGSGKQPAPESRALLDAASTLKL